jgi:2-deoxystreptamine N-acetyl-D-glucosaminyltransferase/2-deoxystreptamine glucosyltransferase
MATGTPVICTDVGGMPEIVRDGETGVVVPPGDATALRLALERLIGDPAAAVRLGAAGRAAVSARFTWHAVARRCMAAYREMAASVSHVGAGDANSSEFQP